MNKIFNINGNMVELPVVVNNNQYFVVYNNQYYAYTEFVKYYPETQPVQQPAFGTGFAQPTQTQSTLGGVQPQPNGFGGIGAAGIQGGMGMNTNPLVGVQPQLHDITVMNRFQQDVLASLQMKSNIMSDGDMKELTQAILCYLINKMDSKSNQSICLVGTPSNPNFKLEIGIKSTTGSKAFVPYTSRWGVYGIEDQQMLAKIVRTFGGTLGMTTQQFNTNIFDKYKETLAVIEDVIGQVVQQYYAAGMQQSLGQDMTNNRIIISYGGLTIAPLLRNGQIELTYSINAGLSMSVVKQDIRIQ